MIQSNADDVYTLTVAPPSGWRAQVGVQSATAEVWAPAEHVVTVLPYQGVELAVAPDSLTTVPMGPLTSKDDAGGVNTGQAQVPGAACVAVITLPAGAT